MSGEDMDKLRKEADSKRLKLSTYARMRLMEKHNNEI